MRRRASLAALPLLVLVACGGGIHGSTMRGQVVIDPSLPMS